MADECSHATEPHPWVFLCVPPKAWMGAIPATSGLAGTTFHASPPTAVTPGLVPGFHEGVDGRNECQRVRPLRVGNRRPLNSQPLRSGHAPLERVGYLFRIFGTLFSRNLEISGMPEPSSGRR
jgi:hypothetical protein